MNVGDQIHRWQRQYSNAANRLKRRSERTRSLIFALLIAGAACSIVPFTPLQTVGALCLATVALVQIFGLSRQHEVSWVGLRRVSEELKRILFLNLIGDPDFADEKAIGETTLLREETPDLLLCLRESDHDTKAVPLVSTAKDYVDRRAHPQIDYYTNRIESARRRSNFWRVGEVVLVIASGAVAIAALVSSTDGLPAAVGVLTTLASVVAAHLAASRFDYDRELYSLTKSRLEAALSAADIKEANSSEAIELVRQIEGILAAEHGLWVRGRISE